MALHQPKRHSFFTEDIKDIKIRLFGLVPESIVDGPGIRYAVFVQGCPHHCPGCHNPESHSFDGGTLSTTTEVWNKIKSLSQIDGVTFSGGEPFCQSEPLAEIGRMARERNLTVMTYSGYTAEVLFEMAEKDENIKKLLTVTNYLVEGRYIQEERDLTLKFRGSRNQRILDITAYPNSKSYAIAEFS